MACRGPSLDSLHIILGKVSKSSVLNKKLLANMEKVVFCRYGKSW